MYAFVHMRYRYILDGDREELRNIKHELASLRIASLSPPGSAPFASTATDPSAAKSVANAWRSQGDTSATTATASSSAAPGASMNRTAPSSFLSDDDRLKQRQGASEQPSTASSSHLYSHTVPQPSYTHLPEGRVLTDPAADTAASLDQSYLSASDSEVQEIIRSIPPVPMRPSLVSDVDRLTSHLSPGDEAYLACLQDLDDQKRELLETGLYAPDDPAILAIERERRSYERS